MNLTREQILSGYLEEHGRPMSEGDYMEKLTIALIGALPRCIYDSKQGLATRCRNIGTHVVELANGEREYGSQVCAKHAGWAKKENPGSTIRELLYAEPLIALAKKLGVELVCDDPQLPGIRE